MTEATIAQRAAAFAVELEARLAVGHEATCSSCGMTVVRVIAGGSPMGFGESAYDHPGYISCPGPDYDGEVYRIDRSRR